MEGSSPTNRCHFQRRPHEPIQCQAKLSGISVSSHSSGYNSFRRTANDNLMKLNSNISEMLTESFKGIDSICSKVRECITDFNVADALQAKIYNESFADEPSTEQMLRKQQEDRYKYEELKERYRKYRTQRRPDDDVFDFTRKSQVNSAENERRFPFGDAPVARKIQQETPRVENAVKKDCTDPEVPVKGDLESSKNVKEKYPENCAKDSEEEILALDDLPDLPEVLVGEKPDEEVAVEKPKKSKAKSSKKRVRRRSLEEYAQAVKKEAQFEDFNSLKAVIQDLTERIDMLSSETLPVKCEEKPENRFESVKTTLMEKRLNDAREEVEDEEEDEEEEEKKGENDPVVSLMKNITRLLGASLANALDSKTSLPIEFLDSRLEAPNPEQEDLLLEDETQKKFLYLEQLLAKRKMDNIKTKNLLNDTSDREVPESSYRSSNIRTRYSNSLYFNEKTMFKTSSKDNLNPHRKSKKINSVLTVMNYSNASMEKLNASETKSKPSKYKKLTENRKPKNRNLEYYKHKLDKFGGTNWKQNLYKSGAIDVSTGGKSCSDDFGFEREASLVSFPNTESSKSETSVDFNRKSGKSASKRGFVNGKTAHSDYEDEIRSDESELSDQGPVFGVANNENKSKGKGNWINSNNLQMPFTHWNHLDILDDLTQKDLLPLCSEYPRKDVSVDEKSQEPNKDIQDTYLWKMVYEQEENDNVWNKLIQPTVEGIKNKSNNICEHSQESSDKTFKKQKSKRRTIEKLAPYMFDPKEESRTNQSLIVMPITVQYNNPPQIVKHNVNEEPDVLPTVVGTSRRIKTSRLEQQQAAREALSDREWSKQRKPKKKNILSPKMNDISKEGGKDFDECAEYREKLTPQQTAYKKAIMRNLVKLKELKMKEKREEQKMAGKSLMQQQKITAACLPHYTQPTIQSQNYFQRPIIQNPEKERHSARRKSADVKTTNVKLRQPMSEFETQSFSDSKSDYERKMLSFKYSKSIGEKLVSFVNNQSPRQDLDVCNSAIPTNNNESPRKQPDLDPRDMVMQLKSLKKGDSSVLSSIQKAVDVIENKMIDLLDAPSDLNFDAFDVMESEIKQVLDIMKVDAKNPERLNGEMKLEENLQKMSMQLFSKLESLLDSGSEYKEVTSGSEVLEEAMHPERPSSVTTLVPETKHHEPRRSPQPKRISRVQSDTKTALTTQSCDMETRKMGEEISNEHIFDKQEDVDADPADFEHFEQRLNTIEQHLHTFEQLENDNPEEEDAFWDTAEQLQRLNDILQDSEEPDYAPLQRQCATTNLDTVQRLDESLIPDDLTDSIMNLRDEQLKKTEVNEDDKEDLGSDFESIDSEDFLTPSHTEFNYVCREEEFLTPPEEAAVNLIREIDISAMPILGRDEEDEDLSTINEASKVSDGSSSNFSDQVNDMIKTVEDIYTRLDRIQKNKNLCDETSTDSTRMQLVKQEPTAVVALETVPASYDNVLNFLEALSDGGETGEVHSARFITRLRYLNNVVDKPSCLRTNDYTKHKKKVSFLVTQQPPTAAALLLPNYHESGRFVRQKSLGARAVVGKLKVTPSLHNILRFLDALIEIGAEEETLIYRNTNKVKVVELDGSAETIPEKKLSNKVFPVEDLGVSRVLLSVKFHGDSETGRLNIETQDKSNGSPNSPKGFVQQRPVVFKKLSPVAGLVRTTGILAQCKSKVVVLKSLYAFVYLLVFTALNMGYKCY